MVARAATWKWEGFHDDRSGGTRTETVRVRGGTLYRGCMDFEKYGQDCMENDCVTKTEFGCCAWNRPSRSSDRGRG